MIFLLNTFLGFLIAQVANVLRRERLSEDSPIHFNLLYFLKDTWLKIVLSLILAFALSIVVWINVGDFAKLLGQQWQELNNIAYVVIGIAPEFVLQYFRNKYGFLKPTKK